VRFTVAIASAAAAITLVVTTAAGATDLPEGASGDVIFRAACATCHALDGKGAPRSVVGFALPLPNGHGFPDFTDCATNTVEPLSDWIAVTARGGPVRALDRHMPAFGDALSPDQLERVVKHLWTFCSNASWPRGELNFPRAFFTEKAFPENETVWTVGVIGSGTDKAVASELVYEHRIGARGQYEIKIPFVFQQGAAGGSRGIGDVEVAVRRTLFASHERGTIAAAGGAVVLPTGTDTAGIGSGYATVEPFAMWGQTLGSGGFLQMHGGLEIPTDRQEGRNEGFMRTAIGYTLAQDQGFGRAWSPMAEIMVARPAGGAAEWDVVPQVQVSLSRLQHVLVSVGVRIPLNERRDRRPEILTYLLWDWFDGGLFRFWK
jgi:mono/diheme cytochrome c family protein